MPKMKTHRGAAKRVKRTGSGQLNVLELSHLTYLQIKILNKNVNYVKLN